MSAERLRLDKWLWQARFFKSRSLASRALGEGGFRIDGELVRKTHAEITPGQVLTFSLGGAVRVIRILALGTRRGPAPEARALYEDLTPPETAAPDRPEAGRRERGAGRPTKRDRRRIDRLRGEP